MVVTPIADLLAEPFSAANRLTQLLLNETLLCLGEEDDWYMVEALEQSKLAGAHWRGYPGWVRKDQAVFIEKIPALDGIVTRGTSGSASPGATVLLSVGTRVEMTQEQEKGLTGIRLPDGSSAWLPVSDIRRMDAVEDVAAKRERVIETAMSFIGTPYLWGGRSALPSGVVLDAAVTRGVDCSGLANLSYRVAGIDIPRDARDQHAAARPLSRGQLKPADLIFLAPGDGREINHVLLYLGEERFVEAAETGRSVETGTFSSRFGHGEIKTKASSPGARHIYYGSFFEERRADREGPGAYGGR